MDLRYIMYVDPKKRYYHPPKERAEKSSYKMPELKSGWYTEIDEHNHWRYYILKGNTLPDQGWKIHISAPIYAAQKILDIVAPILIKQSVEFKYVDNKWELFLKNSKYGDRGGSGKFITIYPKDVDEFEQLIYMLEEALEGTPNGPYILSDKCWKDTNIFFRYGGIRPVYANVGGSKVLAIKNVNGEYIEDTRGPSYFLPAFIKEPLFVKQMDEEQQKQPAETSKLDDFDITGALHFSNAGGVYTAIRKADNIKVVLKEGRPESGLDGDYQDAYSRVYQEAEMLDKLRNVTEVVDYYGIFREWKHIFLEEEYIEGVALNTWTALHYPFLSLSGQQQDYCKNACKVLRNAVQALKNIHNLNIGMGDLQPMNIIVNDNDYSVRLIDFEAANNLENTDLPALVTPGFTTAKAKNRLQGDWFSMSRIARHTFLPIGPVQDIDEGILHKHDLWIEHNFGKEVLDVIREIQREADKYLKPEENENIKESYMSFWGVKDLGKVVSKIREGMIADLQMEDILLGGDIRQFEEKDGKINVKTGGFGVVMALSRTGEIPEIAQKWVEKYSTVEYLNNLNDGLYSGKAGIACVLYEIGQKDVARDILSTIEIVQENRDISLLSGLAGIGIALISLLRTEHSVIVEKKVEEVSMRLQELMQEEFELTIEDPDGVAVGLFCGWTGVALFFLLLYRIKREERWLELAIKALDKDIVKCTYDDYGVYHVDDNKRFFPYLDGGSLGIGMVILEIKKHLGKDYMEKELEGLRKQNYTRCCHNVGLFRGYAGFLAYANSDALFSGEEFIKYEHMLESLNLFLIEEEGRMYCPGDYSYKLSGDLFSGSAGVMLTLFDIINKKKFAWLPIINVDNLLN